MRERDGLPPECGLGDYVGDVGAGDDVGGVYEAADAGDEGTVCRAGSVFRSLCRYLVGNQGDAGREVSYHISPVAKTATTPAFRFGAICKCHVAHMGSRRFRRSENTLTAPETTTAVFLLMQWSP